MKPIRSMYEVTGDIKDINTMLVNRAALCSMLSAMEGVIDVADRKTVEFDALRSCVIDLTLMLHATQTKEAA